MRALHRALLVASRNVERDASIALATRAPSAPAASCSGRDDNAPLAPTLPLPHAARGYASSSSSSSSAAATDPFGAPPRLPQRRVVITGIGLVTPVGVGADAAWQNLVAGATGTRALEADDLPENQRGALASLPSRVVAPVDRAALRASPHYADAGFDARRHAPFVELALCAAREALADARWHPAAPQQRASTGVCLGAGIGCTADTADAGALIAAGGLRRVSPFFVPRILVNMAAGAVAMRHGLMGPNHAPSTACATGVHAVGDAFRAVQRGDAKLMVRMCMRAPSVAVAAITIAAAAVGHRLCTYCSLHTHPHLTLQNTIPTTP